jgi:hypothetical protein
VASRSARSIFSCARRSCQLPSAQVTAITTSAATIGTVPGERQSVRVVTGSLAGIAVR